MAKERTCIFCGKTYQYCPNCRDFSKYPNWMANFDTEKCHELYDVIAGYNIGIRTIEDVKATLDKYGVTDYSIFSKGLQDKIRSVGSPKKEEPKTEIKEEPQKAEVKEETKENKTVNVKKDANVYNNMKKSNKKHNFERRVNTEE